MTDDFIGIRQTEKLDNTFLTVDELVEQESLIASKGFPFEFKMNIKLSNKMVVHSR